MLIYWLIWGLASAGALGRDFASPIQRQVAWLLFAALLVVFVGLRRDVGGDWGTYLDYVERASRMSFIDGLAIDDVGYAALNWIGAQGLGGIYFINCCCAVIAVSGLMIFCSRQANPALALVVAVPYLIVVVFLGYSRQSAAIGFGLLALVAINDGKPWRFLLWVTLATFFHKSGIVFFLFAPALYAGRFDRRAVVGLGAMAGYALFLAFLLLVPRLSWFWNSYVTISIGSVSGPSLISSPAGPGGPLGSVTSGPVADEVSMIDAGIVYSKGAQLRLGIGLLAAALIIVFIWRKLLTGRAAWTWMIGSVCVLFLFILALFKTTLADRFGLYFIPLQLVAFSMVPLLFSPHYRKAGDIGVVLFTAALLGGWLFLADNAPSWIPYDNAVFGPVPARVG